MPDRPCLLLVSPHADDEVLGAPSLVYAACDAGWRVVNLLCFLNPAVRERRLAEVTRATTVMQIELCLAGEPLLSTTARDKAELARGLLTTEIAAAVERLEPAIVVCPGPHDAHYAHEAVAAGVRAALESVDTPARWIMWAWWGELALVTTVSGYGEELMSRARHALAQHRGQLERLSLEAALEARARWNAAVGPERVMGPGYAGTAAGFPYADLVLELGRREGAWSLAEPRIAEGNWVLREPDWTASDPTAWLDAPSAASLVTG